MMVSTCIQYPHKCRNMYHIYMLLVFFQLFLIHPICSKRLATTCNSFVFIDIRGLGLHSFETAQKAHLSKGCQQGKTLFSRVVQIHASPSFCNLLVPVVVRTTQHLLTSTDSCLSTIWHTVFPCAADFPDGLSYGICMGMFGGRGIWRELC